MKVVDDDAEWDVALVQEFEVLITRKEIGNNFFSNWCRVMVEVSKAA